MDAEAGDGLWFAAIEDLEVVLGEIGDAVALGVEDEDWNEDDVDVGFDGDGWGLSGWLRVFLR